MPDPSSREDQRESTGTPPAEIPFALRDPAPSPQLGAAQLLAAIVSSSDDAIISKNLQGIITSWNAAAERLFGYKAEEIIGQSVLTLIPKERHDEEPQILGRLRRGERLEHFETVRLRKSGQRINVSLTISPVRDDSGAIIGASKIARDITESRRAAQAALLLSAVVTSSDDAIISKNLDGIITSWNPGAERIFGYVAGEIIGRSVLTIIPPDRQHEEPQIIEQLRRGQRVEHFETMRRKKNGDVFPVSLTISPMRDSAGQIVGASKIARDITELRRIAAERETLLESERAARAQAEHASRMKDEFLATVSHELRTPLNAIVGWTDILAEGGQGREEVIQGVDVIRKNAMMQAQLIEDLLDLARITSGKLLLHPEPVDLVAIIREAMATLQPAAEAKRILVRTTLGDFRGRLIGDPKRLQQVVWNLLSNALKFTPSGGRVSIVTQAVGSSVQISVADNGRGIAPEFLPHLFERFRQEDGSTTKQHGGLGIGLALVKQLVELHGGKVTAHSDGVGLGASFQVSLPISLARTPDIVGSGESQDASPTLLADLAGVKVLAVDDDVDSLDVVHRILTARGAVVRVAKSVDDALLTLQSFAPNVVLSDIGMPKRDGYDFVRHLRKMRSFAGIPAIALTALARVEDRTRALTAGFQGHIAKPVAAAELVAVVQSMARLQAANAEPNRAKA